MLRNLKALGIVEPILNEPRYEAFVERLGEAAKDPKLRGVLIGGLLDGELLEDMAQHSDIRRMSQSLTPNQHEIE